MKTSVTVINAMSVLAWTLSAVVAIGVPLGYFVLAYQYQTAVLKTELAGEAVEASQMISRNPDYWRFEQHRLQEFLSQRPFGQSNEIRRIVDVNRTVVAESADVIDAPLITRRHDLYDSGKVVARMEISRSLRPLLTRTLLLLAFGLVLGAAVFIVLRVFPLRALSLALQSLQESEGKFRAIASTAADAIIVINDRGVITSWNSAAEKIFGYTAQEAAGR